MLFLARGPILEWIEELLESDYDDEDDTDLTTHDAPADPAGLSAGDPE